MAASGFGMLELQDTSNPDAAMLAVTQTVPIVVEQSARQLDFVERPARLWKAGHYPEYQLDADTEYVDRLISASKTLARIPLEIAMLSGDPDAPHGTGDDRIEIGEVLPGSLYRDGDWLCGKVRLPKAIDDRLNAPTKRKLSVQFNPKTFQLTHTAIVPRERCKGASFSETDFAFAESGAVETENDEPPAEPAKQQEPLTPEADENKKAGDISAALQVL